MTKGKEFYKIGKRFGSRAKPEKNLLSIYYDLAPQKADAFYRFFVELKTVHLIFNLFSITDSEVK
jgi:hypothetical protein